MLDTNWDTINGVVANKIELTNATNQANVLTCLIHFLLAHRGPLGRYAPPPPDEAALLTLHHAGTLFLLANPGEYRNVDVQVKDSEGVVSLQPGAWQSVPGDMKWFFRNLYSLWQNPDPLDAAAFSLWGINYIHPFRNGNGRTARAFCYASLSLKLGAQLPGTPTIVDLMTREPHKPQYSRLLSETDASLLLSGKPDFNTLDLAPLKNFILDLLNIQVAVIAGQTLTS